jgi:ribosomal-protein-alanine N-acetyltransferase
MWQVGRFTVQPMGEADAREIQGWRYAGPYAIYNMHGGDESVAEMLDPRSPYFALRDEHGALIGHFAYGTTAEVEGEGEPRLYGADRVLAIGLGLRPDLTGKGHGLEFVQACVAFARDQYAPSAFHLFVLSFNARAMRVYERAGFRRTRLVRVRNIHGELEFVEMWREA